MIHLYSLSGSKRKNDRVDNQELKRLRPSGHSARQASKRPLSSAGASGKKPLGTRGRHPGEYKSEEYYEDRKPQPMRAGMSRGDPGKVHNDKPMVRRREPDRRIKPLMPDLSEVRARRTVDGTVISQFQVRR